jgi:Mycothiol maleylpyruvate isomerase N-terminal domain
MPVRETYLRAAAVAVELLGSPEVAAAWSMPSALDKMTLGAVAAHLARQIHNVPVVLTEQPGEPVVSVLEHYARSEWVGADLDAEANQVTRRNAELSAADGPAALASQTAALLAQLPDVLAAQTGDRIVSLPWATWSMTLDDFLVTRLVEIAVHNDDLACSVGLPTPALPERATNMVLTVLWQVSARRHGVTAVLRGLTRSERAPASIAAF